jgi:transcriptional regulator with XRE-family HTH domain
MGSGELARLEGGQASEPRLTTALRLAHSVGASLDELAERIYWNPGEVAATRRGRRPPEDRLAGFFSVLPANVEAFEPSAPVPVSGRREAAAILGAELRRSRERRHLTQAAVAGSAGLSKAGLSLIERGATETTIETLISLARSLEVTPAFLLAGIAWESSPLRAARGHGRAKRHGGRSLDEAVTTLWSEGRTAREIADALNTSPGSVSAIVHRLRERGESLAYRRAPTRALHEGARRRRAASISAVPPDGRPAALPPQEAGRGEISDQDIARRVGANVAGRRIGLGMTQEQLAEAAEIDRSYVHQIEKGRHLPRLALFVRLAASLNMRCGLLAAGIAWEPGAGTFFDVAPPVEAGSPLSRLGESVGRARRKAGISQQSLADRAAIGRGDLSGLERGGRNLRVFSVARIAGALGVGLDELLVGVVDWYVRPLPPPELPPGNRPPTRSEREAELERLWREGRPEREIAMAMGWTPGAVGAAVRDLRDAGRDLPYRRPARGASERGARQRRPA